MNKKINILRLSDLHFGVESNVKISPNSNARRKNALNSLIDIFNDLDQDWRPDIECLDYLAFL